LMTSAAGWQEAMTTATATAQALKETEQAIAVNMEQIKTQSTREEATRVAATTAQTAVEAATQLQVTIESLEQARADIATLAASLKTGEACPVCGATEHPAPAHDAKPSHDSKIDSYKAQLKEAESTAEKLPDLQRAAEQSAQQLKTSKQKQDQLEKQLDLQRVAHGEATVEKNHVLKQLPEDLREPGALENAHEQASKTLDGLENAWTQAQKQAQETEVAHGNAQVRHDEIQTAHQLAVQRAADQVEELSKRILEAGFADANQFQQAKRPPHIRVQLSKRVTDWDNAHSAAQDRLQRAEAAAKGLQPPKLDALMATHKTAQDAADAHDEQTALLRERVHQLRRTADGLQEIEEQQGSRRTEFTVVGRLAEVANGKNSHRITFERFVQAEVLDRVLTAANHRFHPMSEGRYRLQRATHLQDKRRGAGLDLEVFDANTGAARPASTLSGGEGFEACLALALGMAETVQAQSGGIHLDSIFVDEGFGSLGSEDLDRVIQGLQSLQEGGRLVGVISHVRELKERIGVQLEVHKSRDGSYTNFVVP